MFHNYKLTVKVPFTLTGLPLLFFVFSKFSVTLRVVSSEGGDPSTCRPAQSYYSKMFDQTIKYRA